MKNYGLIVLFISLALPASAATDMWVTSDRLHRRTCPSTECGSTGRLFFREKTVVYEERGGWARITEYYDAACVHGLSQNVGTGNASCVPNNGIVGGKMAQWVYMDYLSPMRPEDPSAGATGIYKIVAGSDDYRIHKEAFARAAEELIGSGRCTEQDIGQLGGWVKSTTFADSPVYFIYCGEMRGPNKLHLNAATGEIFR
jgi:hypothetical protein